MMIRRANISSPISLIIVLLLVFGCSKPTVRIAEVESPASGSMEDARGFDPLESPQDRRIVPKESPRAGAIVGRQVLVEANQTEQTDSTGALVDFPDPSIDSSNSQAYRVQLFTSRVYGEAHKAAEVAEEIFDQPVFVDYEVPNYKVRAGSFSSRDEAVEYQQQARTAGYSNAWVVMVTVEVKEVAPLYDLGGESLLPLVETVDSAGVVPNVEGGGDSEN